MFGQLVIGPPASGKTTYCAALYQIYKQMSRRAIIINFDPANDYSPQHVDKADIDIADLISIGEVMQSLNLGPNGAMIYCMEYLEKNMDWLFEQLNQYEDAYLIIDCPGQVELFTHNSALRNIVDILSKRDFRLCAVHLVDAHHCTDAAKFISVLLLSLKTMFQLALPQINVLSKVDLAESYGTLAFDLEYYTQVQDLEYLLQKLDDNPFGKKYNALNKAIVGLVEDWSLVSFHRLCVFESNDMEQLIRLIDKANGYVFGGLHKGNESIFGAADSGESLT